MLVISVTGWGGCWLSVQRSGVDAGYLCSWVGQMRIICAAGQGGCLRVSAVSLFQCVEKFYCIYSFSLGVCS